MIYVVAGMHKSGTTLVARLLHESGVSMVEQQEDRRTYDEGNHFERESTKVINYQLLDCKGAYSLSVTLDGPLRVSEGVKQSAEMLVRRLESENGCWGFKDPRTSLTYPFWKQLLPRHRLIVVYRHPLEVWLHYSKNTRHLLPKFRILRPVMSRWNEYYRSLLSCLDKADVEAIVIRFEALLEGQEEFRRLESFTDLKLKDVRIPSLRRVRHPKTSASTAFIDRCAAIAAADYPAMMNRLERLRASGSTRRD